MKIERERRREIGTRWETIHAQEEKERKGNKNRR